MGFRHTWRLSIFSISNLESRTKHEPVHSLGDTQMEESRRKHLMVERRRNYENLRFSWQVIEELTKIKEIQ